MNNDNSGRIGFASRRRVPPSTPAGNFSRQKSAPLADVPPSELSDFQSTQAQNAPTSTQTWGLQDHPLAMVYSPLQSFKGLFDTDAALSRGTLFSDLYLPFEGQDCGKGRC